MEGKSSILTEQARKSPGGTYYMGFQHNNEKAELERIELAARTCYKSEDRITEESSIKMFQNLVRRGHLAMTRFGERTISMDSFNWDFIKKILTEAQQIQYWRWAENTENMNNIIVTANLNSWLNLAKLIVNVGLGNKWRVFIIRVFGNWPVMQEIVKRILFNRFYDSYADWKGFEFADIDTQAWKPGEYDNLKRHYFRVVTDRGITHEIVRHTTLSYAQESTRWINYGGKNKSNDEMIWIPEHLKGHPAFDENNQNCFQNIFRLGYACYNYWNDQEAGSNLVPGDARNFLPHVLKTEICISGYLDKSPYGEEFNQGFSHFVDMRWDVHAHKGIQPIAREIMWAIGYNPDIPTCGSSS